MTRISSQTLIALCLLFVIGAVFAQSYTGRIDLHESQLAGCLRSANDRRDSIERDLDQARFASNAAGARRADGDTTVAQNYGRVVIRATARAARTRSRIVDCRVAFPRPSPLPL